MALREQDVPAALRRAVGFYTGRTFHVEGTESVSIQGTIWSGGTRSTYLLVRMSDGSTAPLDTSKASVKPGDPFGWIPDVEGSSLALPEGYAVAEHCIFCGKDMGIHFYVHPSNLAPLLPAPVTLTERQMRILTVFAGIKASYRKEELRRYGIDLTDEDKQGLVALGLMTINKAGAAALTIEGRNAAR